MKFEFGKATDVTKLAKKVNTEYKEYEQIFLCQDVTDVHIFRLLPGFNFDYEHEEGSYLLEYERFPNDFKHQKLTLKRAKKLLIEDDFENWYYSQSYDKDELLEVVDGGWGIN